MLMQCPMVVSYRLAPLTHFIVYKIKRFASPYVALPNLLAGSELVPEFLQSRAVAADMGRALLSLLDEPAAREMQLRRFRALAGVLRQGANQRSAEAVMKLLASAPASRA